MLSIITIAYNNLEGLKKTYESLIAQDTDDYEWIVVDGASTDGSIDFLKTTHAQWKSEPDNGIYDAMNKGIDRIDRDYMLFLNSGDCFAAPQNLSTILSTINRNPTFIYGDALEQEENGKIREKTAKPYITVSKGLFTHHQAMIYKKTNLRYNTQYKIASDYDFTYRYLMDVVAHDLPVHYIPEPLCIFEGGGVSQTSAVSGRKEQYNIRKSHHISGAKRIYLTQTIAWRFRTIFPNLFWWLKKEMN